MRVRRALAAAAVAALCLPSPARAEDSSPQLAFRIQDPRIEESSGLASSLSTPGVVWTVNDSGGRAQVYGIDDRGRTVSTVTLVGATNRDWEAVAVSPRPGGGSWLWVGDIGDNNSVWPAVRVYRVAEPETPGNHSATPTAYDLVYPDGPRDAEALLVDPQTGRLYVVSKRVQGAAVYQAPATLRAGRVNRLVKVAAAPALVTDGSVAPDGRVALRDYLQAWVSPRVAAKRERVDLPLLPQGESLTWTTDGAALLVGTEGQRSEVWRVPVAGPASPTPTPTSASPSPSSTAVSSAPSPWLVVVAGLALGAGAAVVLRRLRRPR